MAGGRREDTHHLLLIASALVSVASGIVMIFPHLRCRP